MRKLDIAFSQYIRWRDADADGNLKCSTCNTVKHVKSMQCGHFMSRRFHSLRWHAYGNCNPQCYGCNIGDQGRQFAMSKYIDERWGEGTSDGLLERSTTTRKYSNDELIQLTKYYNTQVNELSNKHS